MLLQLTTLIVSSTGKTAIKYNHKKTGVVSAGQKKIWLMFALMKDH